MSSSTTRFFSAFWPRCYATCSTNALADSLSSSNASIQQYYATYLYPHTTQAVYSGTPQLHDGFPGQQQELINAHATNVAILTDSGSLAGSQVYLAGYRHLPIGPKRSAPFSWLPEATSWVFTGSAVGSIPEFVGSNTTGAQASATQLFSPNNTVTTAAAVSSSVKMWPALGTGARAYIYNAGANALWVWPSDGLTGQKFDGMAANSSFILAVSTGRMLVDVTASTWASV